jgi:hypothetical protein
VVGPGGLQYSNKFNGLSCPTLLRRSTEFQGLFLRLSHHPRIFIAGLFANQFQWDYLSELWRRKLAEPSPGKEAIKRFHMFDCQGFKVRTLPGCRAHGDLIPPVMLCFEGTDAFAGRTMRIDGSIVEAKWWCYFGLVFLAGIVIRIVLSGLRECELRWPATENLEQRATLPPENFEQRATLPPEWWRSLCQAFFSTHQSAQVRDYGLPFFLGLLELTAYPYFIATGNLKVIGGWLALKTAARWEGWTKNRSPYQRFLIGNALVIAASVLLATRLHLH